jgi:hypothetical protein
MDFNLRRLGIEDGNITVSFEELTGNMEIVGDSDFEFSDPEKLEEMEIVIEYGLMLDIPDGAPIEVVAHIDNGTYITDEYFSFFYGSFIPIASTDGESMEPFETENWNLTDDSFHSPSHSIADSPNGNYIDNNETWIELASPIDLTDNDVAFLSFWAKWDIESGWDYAQVMASNDDGSNWTPLCGEFNHAGNINQDFEQPIYDGTNTEWVNELISLEDYVGGEVNIAFRLVSDQSVVGDGFYFDDLEILGYGSQVGINEIDNKLDWKIYPNPANDVLHISVSFDQPKNLKFEIIDISGKVIKTGEISSNTDALVSIDDLNSGSYFVRITTANGQVGHQIFQIIK